MTKVAHKTHLMLVPGVHTTNVKKALYLLEIVTYLRYVDKEEPIDRLIHVISYINIKKYILD